MKRFPLAVGHLALGALLCAAVAPLGAPLPARAETLRAEAPFVYQFSESTPALAFEGKGWGHGVGLCQWGARGRALAGQPAGEILGAYYQGTSVQKAVAPETSIRVLLDTARRLPPDQPLRVTGGDGKWALETAGAPPAEAPAGSTLELSGDGSGPRYAVVAPDGTKPAEGSLRAALVLRPLEPGTRFVVHYKPASEVAGRPGHYYDAYRGELIVTPRGDGLETVNRVTLQDYLKGVAPAEMPSTWPAEALKAQVLAARTYAVTQARGRANERFDVDDTTRFQVYLGANAERPNVNDLIESTAGEVIVHRGQPIQAYFFSTCAGWTEDNESVWPGTALPYLRGIQDVDPSGRPYDGGAPRASWSTGALTTGQLEAMLNEDAGTAVGRLSSLDLTRRTPSGRLISIRATGSGGSKTISPSTLQARFNRLRPQGVQQLLSTNFDLKWSTAEAVAQTQGVIPVPAAPQPQPPAGPTAVPAPPTPTAAPEAPEAPTPALFLEATRPAPPLPTAPDTRYFSETGHNVSGPFLRFFEARGGLDLFGYPRTEELVEDGKRVQYFQRARFEHHLDRAGTPYEVQLTLLGDALTADRRPFPGVAPFPAAAERVYVAETGHGLAHGFLAYWRARGGLDAFGHPVSEERDEPNGDGSGRAYTVQHFQRARFEYHPEHAGTP
ncbi:MAG TPA: SpoIID/LytB domain-containing protein, partial [Chloroflexota bacterium]|nr:SpoIID/LytB domain-containing protein [Chloroflexota bacterium]